MKYEDLFVGQRVQDGMYGIVTKIYKKTVHVQWSSDKYDYWIYDLEHLQFLSEVEK